MKPFKDLSEEENKALLKLPAYISILAANGDNQLDETEKKVAIEFVHTKTFTCDERLIQFYNKADQVFKKNIEQLDSELPKEKELREVVVKKEIKKLEKIIAKLGEEYPTLMKRSMNSFTKHVINAHHNILVDFIFPIPISGLSEETDSLTIP